MFKLENLDAWIIDVSVTTYPRFFFGVFVHVCNCSSFNASKAAETDRSYLSRDYSPTNARPKAFMEEIEN